MTDPNLAEEFPWLRQDAAAILGDSRPHTIKELLGKDRLWVRLYRDWLQSYHPPYLEGVAFLDKSKAELIESTKRLGQSYPTFYKAAGDLKDAVRKGPAALARFPWAPSDAASLLGDARPKNFDAMVEEGAGSPWVRAYRGWLADKQPFAGAETWLDWVLNHGSDTETWEQALDPTVEAFADEIGRLKDRLRETHGNKAQRIGRQIGEAAEWVNTVGERGGLIGAAQQTLTGRPAGGGGSAAGAGATSAPAGARPAGAAGAAAGAAAPAAAAEPDAKAAGRSVRAQVMLCDSIIAQATDLSRWVAWLADRFAAFGGSLGEEATNLRGYKQLIDRDAAFLQQQASAAAARLQAGREELFTRLGKVRDAVYTLAWDIDLGYTNYYGGWPHSRIAVIEQELAAAGSAKLRFESSRLLHGLTGEVGGVYDVASALLDNALELIATEIPGYEDQDSAQVWGTHEVVGASAELAGLAQLAAQWASEQPADDEDEATTDAAANAAFGVPYQSFQQFAGQ